MFSPLKEIRKFRIAKLETLRNAGINPYPASLAFPLTEISRLKGSFRKNVAVTKKIGVAGRIIAKRGHGGAVFLDIFDGTDKIQIFFAKDKIGVSFDLFLETSDIGDFAAFLGQAFYTKKKEPTIEAVKWQMLAKTLLPLPEKWHGLQDVEERFRKRYLDILMNKKVRDRLGLRSLLIKELRDILDQNNFFELETPILQPIYGGALAEPFKTHHRMLDIDMYLRIAPELYLKRLLIGGFNKIYELGRNFRNEGVDMTHNPEFTTIEMYAAYWDATQLKKFVAALLHKLIKKLVKKTSFQFEGNSINFPKNVSEIQFWSIIERHALIIHPDKLSRDELELRAKQFGINAEKHDTKEKIASEIFSKVCRPKIIQPVFLTKHPAVISPLAKELSHNKQLVDRFQLVMGGIELVNGFSELNDPMEQRKRMEAQEKIREAGDREAEPMDEDFIEALEYGMPPAAGLAISIDRLTMLLSDTKNIKEVIPFPTLKPKL